MASALTELRGKPSYHTPCLGKLILSFSSKFHLGAKVQPEPPPPSDCTHGFPPPTWVMWPATLTQHYPSVPLSFLLYGYIKLGNEHEA